MTVNIEYETKVKLELSYDKIIKKVIDESIDYEKCPYETEINVILTDNNGIHQINKEYRDIDMPTDVLSFPMLEYIIPADFSGVEEHVQDCFNPETGELILGDIIISVEKVIEQADKYGHSAERELAFLTAHSMMHLFGYDHMSDKEAKVMEAKQEAVLDNIGITR